MSGIPLWLLDVDGVLNAFDPAVMENSGWDDWTTFTANGFVIRYSPEMVKRIASLHDSEKLQVQWLTTWGKLANEHLSEKFGFQEFLVAGERPFRDKFSWWKLEHAQALFDEGYTLIWTDDDLVFSREAMQWVSKHGGEDLYAFAPQGVLTRQELEDIEEWIEARA